MTLQTRVVRALAGALVMIASLVPSAHAQTSPPNGTPPPPPILDRQKSSSLSGPGDAAEQVADRKRGEALAELALKYVGYPYRWGGASPSGGFDCSGLAVYVFGKLGVELPRTANEQLSSGRSVDKSKLQPGDLLIFENTYRPGPSHSAIYIGDGRFVHANDERTGVVINRLADAYWASRLVGARRPSA